MREARNLEISRLIVFITICEEGSITAAAHRLAIAQSALTVTLQKLESALQTTLLTRDVRGVTPTVAGKRLLQCAYEIVNLTQASFFEICGRASEPEGEVSVGLPSSTAAVLAVPLISRITSQYPHIKLRLVETFSGPLWSWLSAGQLDIGVVFDKTSTPEVACEWLGRENLHLIGLPERMRQGKRVDIKTLGTYPLVMPSRLHTIRASLEAHALQVATNLDIRLEVDSGQYLIRMIKTGGWFSVLAPCAVFEELRMGQLAAAPLYPRVPRMICIAQRRSVSNAAAVRCVVEQLKSEATKLISRGIWAAELVT